MAAVKVSSGWAPMMGVSPTTKAGVPVMPSDWPSGKSAATASMVSWLYMSLAKRPVSRPRSPAMSTSRSAVP